MLTPPTIDHEAVHAAYDAFTDAQWAEIDRVSEALEHADARGMTPSALARKAKITTQAAYRYLRLLVADRYAHASGNGAWTRYHPGRAR